MFNELASKNDSLEDENEDVRIKLRLAQTNYDISFAQTNVGAIKYTKIIAPRLDSALLPLPYYGGKLRFDPDKDVWVIILPK